MPLRFSTSPSRNDRAGSLRDGSSMARILPFVTHTSSVSAILLEIKRRSNGSSLLFPNPATGRSYHASPIQQDYIRRVGWCLVACPLCAAAPPQWLPFTPPLTVVATSSRSGYWPRSARTVFLVSSTSSPNQIVLHRPVETARLCGKSRPAINPTQRRAGGACFTGEKK